MRAAAALSLLTLVLVSVPASAATAVVAGPPGALAPPAGVSDAGDPLGPVPFSEALVAFAGAQVALGRSAGSTLVHFTFGLEDYACRPLTRGPSAVVVCAVESTGGPGAQALLLVELLREDAQRRQDNAAAELGAFRPEPEPVVNEVVASSNELAGSALQCLEACLPAQPLVLFVDEFLTLSQEQVQALLLSVPEVPAVPGDPAVEAAVADVVAALPPSPDAPDCDEACASATLVLTTLGTIAELALADAFAEGETLQAVLVFQLETRKDGAEQLVAVWQASAGDAAEALVGAGTNPPALAPSEEFAARAESVIAAASGAAGEFAGDRGTEAGARLADVSGTAEGAGSEVNDEVAEGVGIVTGTLAQALAEANFALQCECAPLLQGTALVQLAVTHVILVRAAEEDHAEATLAGATLLPDQPDQAPAFVEAGVDGALAPPLSAANEFQGALVLYTATLTGP